MAFSFDDFSKFFDPVSDILGTSGRQGVGLLQQKPEDIAMAAAAAYLMANGLPVTSETLAAAEAAEPVAAAGQSAALTTPAPSQSIFDFFKPVDVNDRYFQIVGDQGPLESIAAPYGRDKGILDYLTGSPGAPRTVEPAALTLGDTTVSIPTDPYLETYFSNTPVNIGSQDIGFKEGFNKAALEDYQNTQFQKQFQDSLATRQAEMPFADIQQFSNPAPTTQNVIRGNPAEAGFQPPQISRGGYFNNGINGEYTDTLTPFERGMDTAGRYFDKASNWAKENPYSAAGLGYYTAYKTGLLDQPKQEPIPDNYKNPYSMVGFRRSSPSPSVYQYTPRYVKGGITSVQGYAKGGRSRAQSAMDFYDAMNPQEESMPLRHGDPGIYYDLDPDTRYLDPMEAAMVRMSKLNSRTNVQAPSMTPSRRLGELDFKPVAAARGGIMGYAAGGDVPIEDDEFNRLTRRGGGGPPAKQDPGEKFNPVNTAFWASDHPILSLPGRYLTSPVSTIGMLLNMVNPKGIAEANTAFQGINPEAVARLEAQPERQAENIRSIEAMSGSGGDVPSGPSDSEQAANRADVAQSGLARGGIAGYNLGDYAAGGNPRLLRGPGDGMSDNIPATINNRQPARLADGEYVVTADVVSHLGNGSTEAGAKQLDAMMKRVRKGRTGTPKQGKQINPRKYLPA